MIIIKLTKSKKKKQESVEWLMMIETFIAVTWIMKMWIMKIYLKLKKKNSGLVLVWKQIYISNYAHSHAKIVIKTT